MEEGGELNSGELLGRRRRSGEVAEGWGTLVVDAQGCGSSELSTGSLCGPGTNGFSWFCLGCLWQWQALQRLAEAVGSVKAIGGVRRSKWGC